MDAVTLCQILYSIVGIVTLAYLLRRTVPRSPIDKAVQEYMKDRPGDQPLPVKNNRVDIQTLVTNDITERRKLGIERYGTALQAHNGRDMLRDAYEEALDLTIYLRGCIEERDNPNE
jgi:hypothetical protein